MVINYILVINLVKAMHYIIDKVIKILKIELTIICPRVSETTPVCDPIKSSICSAIICSGRFYAKFVFIFTTF